MFLCEPAPTRYDLTFRLLGVPVRLSVWFWLAVLAFGGLAADGRDDNPALVFVLTGVVLFVSLLVHEFGHAVVMGLYGERPRIVLYHLGGLAIPGTSFARQRRPVDQILIGLAGPAAGFLLAGLTIGAVWAFGGQVLPVLPDRPTRLVFWQVDGIVNRHLFDLVYTTLYFNIVWGLLNLLPVYPLDGGQFARAALTLVDRARGPLWSLYLSIGTAVFAAVAAGFVLRDAFLVMLFASLAINNVFMLQGMAGPSGGRPWHPADDRPWKRWN